MDLMSGIAQQSMSISAARFAQEYSVGVTKKAMDGMEQQALALLEMLPDVPKGQYIDVRV